MNKKTTALFLSLLMIFSIFSNIPTKASAISIDEAFTYLSKKMPGGTYWNHIGTDYSIYNANRTFYNLKTTTTPCNHYDGHCSNYGFTGGCGCNSFENSTQCMGFARFICDFIYGQAPNGSGSSGNNWLSTSISDLKPGDYIRYKIYSSDYGHSVVVKSVSTSGITVAECNYGGPCIVSWSRKISFNELKSYYSVKALTFNGKPIKHDFENTDNSDKETDSDALGLYKIQTNGDGLNIRAGASVDSEKLGTIPDLEKIKIYEIKNNWGYTKYNSIKGWVCMDYTVLIESYQTDSDSDVLSTDTDSFSDIDSDFMDTDDFSNIDTDLTDTDDFGNVDTDVVFIRGDVDGDNAVSMVDVTIIQKIIANIIKKDNLSEVQLRAADVNVDGEITMLDVTDLQKMIAGIK